MAIDVPSRAKSPQCPEKPDKQGLSPRKFLVPSCQTEAKLMCEQLIKAVSTEAEANQIIAMRQNAYNKAVRDF
jgi:hypothetical protein